ncbi:unnamed protein product [Cylicostephanus goldi]|uniref:Peptidylamidoglycolate lyase n=1 Tax=Cylicostephanus goldi TaxID=71465 RepID=A0A3P7MT80_CYLGO|nr:unnamed protein product [Cylicostephanus goldi]
MIDKTPIADHVILIVTFDGKVRLLKKLGKNKFYMPHGFHIDKDNFFYTTDAGSHTVAKWRVEGDDLELVWESGVKMKPGTDDIHFCKPTAIVTNDEGVFVTDGYCNNRIVQLDITSGKRMFEFGMSGPGYGTFNLPHDIVTSFPSNHLFVADRENGKVQEFNTRGDFVLEWSSNLFSNIYSVDTHDDYVYMVPGRADRNTVG